MPAPRTFEEYWDIVTSNDLWYDNIKIRHARKDIKGVAQEAFIDLCAQKTRLAIADPTDFQQHLSKFLMYAKEQVQKPQLQQTEPEPVDKVNQLPPLTGEARQAKLKEWFNIVQSFDGNKIKPLLNEQYSELGQTDPPKKRGHIVEFDPEKQLQIKKELDERTRKGRELWFRDNHPNATESEILAYLEGFEK
jgi:hypothetical protein